jgi:hypothetical protein
MIDGIMKALRYFDDKGLYRAAAADKELMAKLVNQFYDC